MTVVEYTKKNRFCEKCIDNGNTDCGPWQEGTDIYKSCLQVHKGHLGWKVATSQDIDRLRGITEEKKIISMDWLQAAVDAVGVAATAEDKVVANREFSKGTPIEQVEAYLNTVVADDSALVKRLLRCGLSMYSNDPINLGILAPSSEGKTHAAVQTMELFPKEDVIFVGRMSPTALAHDRGILVDDNLNPIEQKIRDLKFALSKCTDDEEEKHHLEIKIRDLYQKSKKLVDLTGKTLLFLEPPNSELWDILKPILSHDKKEIEHRITLGKKGDFKTLHIVLRGWPACIFCSARNENKNPIWAEIETRFVITNPNMTVQKYKDANKLTGKRKGLPGFARLQSLDDEKWARHHILQLKATIQKYSNDNPVWNPFADVISEVFPSDEGRRMRNYNHFTSFTNMEALINAKYRYRVQFIPLEGITLEYPITNLEDIENSIKLLGVDSTIPENKLLFVRDVLKPLYAENPNGVDTDQLARKYTQVYHKSTTPKKILESYLYPLGDAGIAASKEDQKDRRKKLWYPVIDIETKTYDFIKSKIIEESKNNDLFIWSCVDELTKYSIQFGSITIVDPDGYAIGSNLLQKELTGIEPQGKSNNYRMVCA